MPNPFMLIASLIALSVLYVLLPEFVLTLFEYRGTRRLRCPETGTEAEVGLAAGRAALSRLFGTPRLQIATCSLWPVWSGCGRRCLGVTLLHSLKS